MPKLMGNFMGMMGSSRRRSSRRPDESAAHSHLLGAEDGIRTRDPHLGKKEAMTSVGLRPLVPLSRVFPVGFSADSAASARFRERWFNALNEPGFAESSRRVVDSPSNRVRPPPRTTDTSSRPPSALTYASSTSIVTFLDFSSGRRRGCATTGSGRRWLAVTGAV